MLVERKTETSDGHGGWTAAWASLYASAPCRLQPMGGTEQVIYDKWGVPSTHKLFCDSVYSLVEDDRITVDSSVYDISLVRDIDLLSHHREIQLRRVKPNL